jgi:hypothetical protein
MAYRDKTPAELVDELAGSWWSHTKPFFKQIENLSPEKRELLKQLKSDDLKNRNWLFRK